MTGLKVISKLINNLILQWQIFRFIKLSRNKPHNIIQHYTLIITLLYSAFTYTLTYVYVYIKVTYFIQSCLPVMKLS